jgi:DNA-binding NarL/FixJ family response regulator
MHKKIRILMIEDHPEFRETIAFVLNKSEDLELVSQFGNAELALRSLQNPKPENNIDIILLDLKLPGISGLEAIPWILEYQPKSKIIVLSQSDAEADVLNAIQLGAEGYLLKASTMDQIKQGIRNVYAGGATLTPALAKFVLHTLQAKLPKNKVITAELSKREYQVLELIAEGLSQKEVGNELNISSYTVTDHLKSIYEKLQVQNAPQAISKAYKTGIFKTE